MAAPAALSLDQCLELMDELVRPVIRASLERYHSIGLLVYENHDLSSRLIGCRFAIGYGPENTIQAIPADGSCPVTPPEGYAWQYRLAAFSVEARSLSAAPGEDNAKTHP